MPRLLVLPLLALLGCPAAEDAGTEATGESTGGTAGSETFTLANSGGSTWGAGGSESSGTEDSTGSSSGGSVGVVVDLPAGGSCAPDHAFCLSFTKWCSWWFDAGSCEAIDPTCEEWTNVADLCDAASVTCFEVYGEDAMTCLKGHAKCLAAAYLEGCELQPAVFPCADLQVECPPGWAYDTEAGYCSPPCEVAESTGGEPTTTGGPPEDGECGPAYYSTCEDGYCAPQVLILC